MKKRDSKTANGSDLFQIKLKMTTTAGLIHTLGLDSNVVELISDTSSSPTSDVMDSSYGLNSMFIKCKSVIPIQMGYIYKSNLLACPLQLGNEECKDNKVTSYVPNNHKRTLRPGMIDSIHIEVTDFNDKKLYFNSGKNYNNM